MQERYRLLLAGAFLLSVVGAAFFAFNHVGTPAHAVGAQGQWCSKTYDFTRACIRRDANRTVGAEAYIDGCVTFQLTISLYRTGNTKPIASTTTDGCGHILGPTFSDRQGNQFEYYTEVNACFDDNHNCSGPIDSPSTRG